LIFGVEKGRAEKSGRGIILGGAERMGPGRENARVFLKANQVHSATNVRKTRCAKVLEITMPGNSSAAGRGSMAAAHAPAEKPAVEAFGCRGREAIRPRRRPRVIGKCKFF